MPENETGKDPWGAFRGSTCWERFVPIFSVAWEQFKDKNYIPPYQPANEHWEVTFRALGWNSATVNMFWVVFWRMNKSRDGEVSLLEFLNYFNFDRTLYVEKCFSYFDTTGGDDIDFLEFIVAVWNICTLDPETLTNFTFDLYDLDSDGELSFPEIEHMVEELFGKVGKNGRLGKECLKDLTLFAEKRGGILSLESFGIFTLNHSMLLFPVFQIQRRIQRKVLGMRFWGDIRSGKEKNGSKLKCLYDPRHVQILLRTYKAQSAAAVFTHTGDPNEGLRKWFERDQKARLTGADNEKTKELTERSLWRKIGELFLDQEKWNQYKVKHSSSVDSEKHHDKQNPVVPEKSEEEIVPSSGKLIGNHRNTSFAQPVVPEESEREIVSSSGDRFRNNRDTFFTHLAIQDPDKRLRNDNHGFKAEKKRKERNRETFLTHHAIQEKDQRIRNHNHGFKSAGLAPSEKNNADRPEKIVNASVTRLKTASRGLHNERSDRVGDQQDLAASGQGSGLSRKKSKEVGTNGLIEQDGLDSNRHRKSMGPPSAQMKGPPLDIHLTVMPSSQNKDRKKSKRTKADERHRSKSAGKSTVKKGIRVRTPGSIVYPSGHMVREDQNAWLPPVKAPAASTLKY